MSKAPARPPQADTTSAEGGRASSHRLLIAIAVAVVAAGISVLVWGAKMAAVGWIGDMFLDALKMLVVPLLMASLIVGVARLGELGSVRRIGWVTAVYYLVTTAIAAVTGLLCVNLVSPGTGVTLEQTAPPRESAPSTAIDLVRSFVSDSLIGSMAELDVLPLIVFSIAFGLAITRSTRAKAVIEVFEGINDAMLSIVRAAMWLAPVGIFALVAARFAESEDMGSSILALGRYSAVVLGGLAFHGIVTLVAMVWLLGRVNPLRYLASLGTPLLTAFSTASSLATLPLTMDAVHHFGVSDRTSRFVLPVGATINMDGTALYESVAAIFIAQVAGIELSLGQQVIVVVTATLSAIGAAGIPEAGLVTLLIVLRSVDLPVEGIGLLLALDWLLDRFRTVINVWGDATGAAVVDRFVAAELQTPTPSTK